MGINGIPEDVQYHVLGYLGEECQAQLEVVNKELSDVVQKFQSSIFEFTKKELDEALSLKPSFKKFFSKKYITYKDEKFSVKKLNVIQRIFRRIFGCYKETHLETLDHAKNITVANSNSSIKSKKDEASIKKIGKFLSEKIAETRSTNITDDSYSIVIGNKKYEGTLSICCSFYSNAIKLCFTLKDSGEYVYLSFASKNDRLIILNCVFAKDKNNRNLNHSKPDRWEALDKDLHTVIFTLAKKVFLSGSQFSSLETEGNANRLGDNAKNILEGLGFESKDNCFVLDNSEVNSQVSEDWTSKVQMTSKFDILDNWRWSF